MTSGEWLIVVLLVANLAVSFYTLSRFDRMERDEWHRRNRP